MVLSACDSGRGEVRIGQGVYGLRRAVMLAGAEALVTSLWRVDDDVARELMVTYYRGLVAGRGRYESLRTAQLAVRATHPNPRDWSAFILMGRAAPLHGVGAQSGLPSDGLIADDDP